MKKGGEKLFSFVEKNTQGNQFALYTLYILQWPVAQFLDGTQTKGLRVFLLAIHSHLYCTAWDSYFSKLSRNPLQFLQFSYCAL